MKLELVWTTVVVGVVGGVVGLDRGVGLLRSCVYAVGWAGVYLFMVALFSEWAEAEFDSKRVK